MAAEYVSRARKRGLLPPPNAERSWHDHSISIRETRRSRGHEAAAARRRPLADRHPLHERRAQQTGERLRPHSGRGEAEVPEHCGSGLKLGQPARDAKVTLGWVHVGVDRYRSGRLGTEVEHEGHVRRASRGRTSRASKLGSTSLDKILPRHIEGWVVELRAKGLAQSTIRTAYSDPASRPGHRRAGRCARGQPGGRHPAPQVTAQGSTPPDTRSGHSAPGGGAEPRAAGTHRCSRSSCTPVSAAARHSP